MLKSIPMNFEDSISYLYGLQKHGMKFGLDNIQRMLSLLGEPQRSFRSVHIAGTNGKGSTSAMIESIVRRAGYRTGLFTSPHLVSFTERIRIGGQEISKDDVIAITDEIRNKIRGTDLSPTFFEFVTLMGFLYFKSGNVQWAVVETGMGGRLDATNILLPEVSVITPIGFDHKEFLGTTLREIATEKAGIIKPGVPLVTSAQEPEALNVLTDRAKETSSAIFIEGRDFSAEFRGWGKEGIVIDYKSPELNIKDIEVHLLGRHQAKNAALAIKTAEIILGKEIEKIVKEALSSLRWQGRLEIISEEPEILIDGAHNLPAAKTLAEALKEIYISKGRKINLIIGIMADKDIDGMLSVLLPLATRTIFTAPAFERAESPERLKNRAKALGYDADIAGSVREALLMTDRSALTVVTGSFYTIGEAKEALGAKAVLKELRETLRSNP